MSDPVTDNVQNIDGTAAAEENPSPIRPGASTRQARRLARRWSRRQALHESPAAPPGDATAVSVPEAAPSADFPPPPPARQNIDAGMIALEQCIERPFPEALRGARREDFQVVTRQSALDSINAHAASRMDVEICGVLVGDIFRDESGAYLEIDASIAGAAASSHVANVTFTADTWQHIQAEMDHFHSGKKIVGWYHSHPDFGIFLSKMDLFIHENFFNLPWQVAFVRDPVRREDGIFIWRNGQASAEEFLVDRSVVTGETADSTPAAYGTAGIDPLDGLSVGQPKKDSGHDLVSSLIAAALDGGQIGQQAQAASSIAEAPHLTNPFSHPAAHGAGGFSDGADHGVAAAVAEISIRLRRIEKRQKSFAVVLAVGMLMLFAWPIVAITLLGDRGTPTMPRLPDSHQSVAGPAASQAVNPFTAQDPGEKRGIARSGSSAAARTAHIASVNARKFALSNWLPFLPSAWGAKSGVLAARSAARVRNAGQHSTDLGDRALMAHATIPPAPKSTTAAVDRSETQISSAAGSRSGNRSAMKSSAAAHRPAPLMQPAAANADSDSDPSDDDTQTIRVDPNGGGGAKILEVDQ